MVRFGFMHQDGITGRATKPEAGWWRWIAPTRLRCGALFLICFGEWLVAVSSQSDAATAPLEITTFHQFYAMTPDDAAKGIPIRIKGLVLCYDASWNQFYVHDGTEVGWLSPQGFPTNLEAGMNVEITGSSTVGQTGLVMTNLQLQVLGRRSLPSAKRLDISQLGREPGQWVETTAKVRVVDTSLGRLLLVVQGKSQTCLVYVMGSLATNDFKWLLGSSARIRGINSSKSAGNRLESASLCAPGLNEITVLNRGAKPTEIPVVSIDSLLNRKLGRWTNDPVHLNGLVVSYKPGDSLTIKDATGVIRAQVIQTTSAQVDGRVDLWGYLAVMPGGTILHDAYFDPHETAAKPAPTPVHQSTLEMTSKPAEITRFSEISKMSHEDASESRPVRLRGTVTFADADWRNCFIQDRRGAIHVVLNQKDIVPGLWVEVSGQTSPGGFAPEVVNSSIRILSTTNMPEPVNADLEDLANGHLDSHWVQLEGVVRRVSEEWGHVTLSLTTPKGRFKAVVLKANDEPLPQNLIDALVNIRGACTSEMNARGQLTGVSLRVPGLKYVSILESVPVDPFMIPATAIKSVATFDPGRLAGRRVKVTGKVTSVLPGEGFFVQDYSGGIRVNTTQTNELQPGDFVHALGFPAMGEFSPYLEEASFKRVHPGYVPRPQVTTAEAILRDGTNDASLVQIEASLVQSVPRSAHPRLVLQSGPIIFTAGLANQPADGRIPAFPVGSKLQLTGVCLIQGGEGREPESFRVLISKADDVELLSTPPWWTVQHGLMLVGGLAIGGLLAWAWSGSLRRQVRAQTQVIRKNHEELVLISRQAGMAEVATAVLHNVGNVLNSVNISAAVVADAVRKSRSGNVSRVAAMMHEHAADLGHFITREPKGRQLPDYLAKLGERLAHENRAILDEIDCLTSNIQHINEIVAMQQSYAQIGGVTEKIKVTALIEDAFRMNMGAFDRHNIQLLRDYDAFHCPEITVDKHKVLQILVNLLSNAKYACAESPQPEKRVTIRVASENGRIKISCADNGIGIQPENLTRIFNHGFTTRKNGHGFGLHSAALAAQEMGGTLVAHSDGTGRGATFTLDLPLSPKQS